MPGLPNKATHQQTKTFNAQLVLKVISDAGEISRAEVARQTGLPRTTVSDLVTELLERGLIEAVGRGPSTGGKSPIFLSVIPHPRHIIALDLSEENLRGAVVNLRGEIRQRVTEPLHGRRGQAALELAFHLVDALVAAASRPLLGIGIGAPGLIDTSVGQMLWAVNLDWMDLPIGQQFEQRYGVPVYLANDCQVAALAQLIYRQSRTGSLAAIKLGTGLGAGIVLNGQLFQGAGFGAGEIGHIIVAEDGLPCRCGNRGCLETIATLPRITERAQNIAGQSSNAAANQAPAAPHYIPTLSGEQSVLEAYLQGDPAAGQAMQEAAAALGRAIAGLISFLYLGQVWLMGDAVHFGAAWLEQVRRETRRHTLAALAEQTTIQFSDLDKDVVMLGASALLLTRELGLDLAR